MKRKAHGTCKSNTNADQCLRQRYTPKTLSLEASRILQYLTKNQTHIIKTGCGKSSGTGVLWERFGVTYPNPEASGMAPYLVDLEPLEDFRRDILPLKMYALELVVDACENGNTPGLIPGFFSYVRTVMNLHHEWNRHLEVERVFLHFGQEPGGALACVDVLAACHMVMSGPEDERGCEDIRAEFWDWTDAYVQNWELTEIAALDGVRLGITASLRNQEVKTPRYYDTLARKNVLSTQEACDYLNLSKSTLYQYRRVGRIATGNRGRWERLDLDAFRNENKVRESPGESDRVR